jgi:hypothetical protein
MPDEISTCKESSTEMSLTTTAESRLHKSMVPVPLRVRFDRITTMN